MLQDAIFDRQVPLILPFQTIKKNIFRSSGQFTINKGGAMGFFKEFKEFAMRGNVADMAVGIIIGAAFGKIVSSLVEDVIMPPLGLAIGGIDFTSMAVTLKQAAGDAAAVTLNYGKFVQTVFDFTIVAFAIFLAIKAMNSLKRKEEAAPAPAPPRQEILLEEIRDLLKK
jgi:large conductance mechanosensitive channel